MTDGVYERHAARVHDGQRYAPEKEVQGYYTEKVKALAKTTIEGKDEAGMRCATFKEIDATCRALGQIMQVKRHKMYPALNIVGRDKVYSQFKVDGTDVFADIKELRERKFDLSYSSMVVVDEVKRFVPTTLESRTQRVTRSTKRRAQDIADDAGIRTSELNLYFVMHGIKTLIEVEPNLMHLQDNEVVMTIMRVLRESESNIQRYCDDMRSNTNGIES